MVPAQLLLPTYAALLPRGVRYQLADAFSYVVEFLTLTPLETRNFDLSISNDSDFLWVAAACQVTSADNQTSVPFFPATITFKDQGSGRDFQTRAQHLMNVSGGPPPASGLPWYLPMPKLIDRGSTFTVTIASLDTANTRNIRYSLHGFKLFGKRPSDAAVMELEQQSFLVALATVAKNLAGSQR